MNYLPIILLYNNGTHLPFPFTATLYSEGWTISYDKNLINKAAIVVFHLPTLAEAPLEQLEKMEGQVWIGWRQAKEPDIRDDAPTTWECIFDLYIVYPPQCYWECSITHGKKTLFAEFTSALLDNLKALRRKVDFMLIGTQKGGSTALHEYLAQHPSCWGSYFKETGFFLYPNMNQKGLVWYMNQVWRERLPYRFSKSNCLLFESSTWYSYWHEIPQRLYEYNPELKFIFLIRNPIERAYSQYNMLIHWSKEQLLYEYSLYPDKMKLNKLMDQLLDVENYPFDYWVEMEIDKINNNQNNPSDFFPDFLHRGIYYEQLMRYYHFYSKESILIIENGELKENRIKTLKKIERFLNIPSANWNNVDLNEKFVSHYDDTITYSLRKKLRTFFKPYNKKLYNFINKNYDWQ